MVSGFTFSIIFRPGNIVLRGKFENETMLDILNHFLLKFSGSSNLVVL